LIALAFAELMQRCFQLVWGLIVNYWHLLISSAIASVLCDWFCSSLGWSCDSTANARIRRSPKSAN